MSSPPTGGPRGPAPQRHGPGGVLPTSLQPQSHSAVWHHLALQHRRVLPRKQAALHQGRGPLRKAMLLLFPQLLPHPCSRGAPTPPRSGLHLLQVLFDSPEAPFLLCPQPAASWYWFPCSVWQAGLCELRVCSKLFLSILVLSSRCPPTGPTGRMVPSPDGCGGDHWFPPGPRGLWWGWRGPDSEGDRRLVLFSSSCNSALCPVQVSSSPHLP